MGLPLDGKRAFVWSFLIEALHEGRSSSRGEGAARGPHLEEMRHSESGIISACGGEKIERNIRAGFCSDAFRVHYVSGLSEVRLG